MEEGMDSWGRAEPATRCDPKLYWMIVIEVRSFAITFSPSLSRTRCQKDRNDFCNNLHTLGCCKNPFLKVIQWVKLSVKKKKRKLLGIGLYELAMYFVGKEEGHEEGRGKRRSHVQHLPYIRHPETSSRFSTLPSWRLVWFLPLYK